jgi:hypothetical protein
MSRHVGVAHTGRFFGHNLRSVFMLGTKKPKSEFCDLPTLEGDPRWVEINRVVQREVEHVAECRQRCDDANAFGVIANPPVIAKRQEQVEAWATGTDIEFRPSAVASDVGPAESLKAAENALTKHQAEKERLRHNLMAELGEPWEALRLKARRKIVQAAIDLKTAFEEEQTIAQRMLHAEVVDGNLSIYRPLCNFASAARLPNAVKVMHLNGFREANANLLTD